MENFVVRIYRRDTEDPNKVAGIVEVLGGNQEKSFVNLDGLRAILTAKTTASGKKKKGKET